MSSTFTEKFGNIVSCGCKILLIIRYNNSVISCDGINIDEAFLFPFVWFFPFDLQNCCIALRFIR